MSTINSDLPNHAANKVQRALQDVLQLTDDPAERMRIHLFVAGSCIGAAGANMALLMRREGLDVEPKAAQLEILSLLRKLVADGAEAAWDSLKAASK